MAYGEPAGGRLPGVSEASERTAQAHPPHIVCDGDRWGVTVPEAGVVMRARDLAAAEQAAREAERQRTRDARPWHERPTGLSRRPIGWQVGLLLVVLLLNLGRHAVWQEVAAATLVVLAGLLLWQRST